MTARPLALLLAIAAAPFATADFTLTILHTNDLHGHVEPNRTRQFDLGGYARQATLIRRLKAESTNPILLNAGDTFQGTLYFNVYVGLADLAFMNAAGYQAMAAGNHEFDRGPAPLADFARLAKFPVLAANLDVSKEPLLKDLIKPSTVIEVGGEKVGVVGCVTTDLPTIANPGPNVTMLPLRESVQGAVDGLRAQGVDKIVLLSHIGFTQDLELAGQLRGVDVVVGGHSHTLLGRYPQQPFLTSRGAYPTVVKDADGKTTLVAQAWEWGKVFGRLEVKFDASGEVESWTDEAPILVSPLIEEDPTIAAMVAAFARPIATLKAEKVGSVTTTLPREAVDGESLMGNVIADAMLAKTVGMGSVAAFMNAGGVRSSLEAGDVTFGDAIEVQPFNNSLVLVDLTGSEILAALEHGASRAPQFGGGLLYPSAGTSYELDATKPAGSRVTNARISGAPLDPSKTYRVTLNSFTAGGGDGHEALRDAKGARTDTGFLDIDALVEFVKAKSPIAAKPEGRVKVRS